jgi:hypothetical protein
MRNSKYAKYITPDLVDTDVAELSEIGTSNILRDQEFNIIDTIAYGDGDSVDDSAASDMGPSLRSLGITGRRAAEPVREDPDIGGELDITGEWVANEPCNST